MSVQRKKLFLSGMERSCQTQKQRLERITALGKAISYFLVLGSTYLTD